MKTLISQVIFLNLLTTRAFAQTVTLETKLKVSEGTLSTDNRWETPWYEIDSGSGGPQAD